MSDSIESTIINNPSDSYPIDILNRQEIIEQIMQFLDTISKTNGSCTLALNGKWGSGKSFVLNMLEHQLVEYQAGEKYFVFNYNCWQYDYYEEPLIAIVAAMLDSLNKDVNLIPEIARAAFTAGSKIAAHYITEISKDIIKNKIGVDVSHIIDVGKEITEGANKELIEQHKYDCYYAFKTAIQKAKTELQKLAEERTIIVIVDELDRCLPNYAIKVLERLHHLFYGNINTIVLLAVDKTQLDTTIQSTFGSQTNASEYLKKFINYEFTLDVGTINKGFKEKYFEYVSMFDESLIEPDFNLDEFASALFGNIDIRTQEHLMERIKTIHKILFPDIKKDYSFMCYELFWLVIMNYYNAPHKMPFSYSNSKFSLNIDKALPHLTNYLENNWGFFPARSVHSPLDKIPTLLFTSTIGIPQLIIWYFGQRFPNRTINYQLEKDTPRFSEYLDYIENFKQIEKMLKIIK